MTIALTAARFVEHLAALVAPPARPDFLRAHSAGRRRADADGSSFAIRMGSIFELAKTFIDLPPEEIDRLLDSPVHEVRVGALSVMDKQARRNATPEARRKELFDLYLRRSDAIDSWISWISVRRTSSAATSGTSPGRCSTDSRARRALRSGAQPS